jgi:hypothetical protein
MPGGVEQVAQKLAEARRTDPKAVVFSEAVVNLMGYEHLQAGYIKNAVEILKLNLLIFLTRPTYTTASLTRIWPTGQKNLARQNEKKRSNCSLRTQPIQSPGATQFATAPDRNSNS